MRRSALESGKWISHHEILYHEGLPAIEDLQDRAKATAILVRMWPLQLQDIQDDDGKTDYTREWNLFEHAPNNQLRVLHIEASITRNEYKKKDILFHGFVVREGFFRLSDPADPKDMEEFPSEKKKASNWNSTQVMGHDYDEFALGGGCGLVYRFLCHHYPERPSVNGSPGWEKSPAPFPAIRVESEP